MARRIVIDRTLRGPFVTRDGLRRVTGVGPAFLSKIDSLVTFTGTVTQPSASDTVIARNRKVRGQAGYATCGAAYSGAATSAVAPRSLG